MPSSSKAYKFELIKSANMVAKKDLHRCFMNWTFVRIIRMINNSYRASANFLALRPVSTITICKSFKLEGSKILFNCLLSE